MGDDPTTTYTTVDLNSTGTTTIYDGDVGATIQGVYMKNDGGNAIAQLEVTDGTDTGVIRELAVGGNLEYDGDIDLPPTDDLQINVTTAEGSAETAEVVVVANEGL